MIPGGLLLVVTGMLLVRIGWDRHRAIARVGWLLMIVASVLLGRGGGAWGLAIGTLAGMAVGLLAVLAAGWRSPARTRRAPRDTPAIEVPRSIVDLARRTLVFLLSVPFAFGAAAWLALAAERCMRAHGAEASNAIVAGWFVLPIAWMAILVAQMTRASVGRMVAPLVISTLAGVFLWDVP